ncbi:homeodomain-only protein [Antennarius striatus]|uniref:homeodomain-only protein n=1 Tax=Antennarius striatus TaxID=241820 RepID=UPI0035B4222F
MASGTTGALKLSEDQMKVLEEGFVKSGKNPSDVELMLIAAECRLSEADTEEWFRLRNAQWRASEGLPAKGGSVLD